MMMSIVGDTNDLNERHFWSGARIEYSLSLAFFLVVCPALANVTSIINKHSQMECIIIQLDPIQLSIDDGTRANVLFTLHLFVM